MGTRHGGARLARRARPLAATVLTAWTLAGLGCAGEPSRTYYDDRDATGVDVPSGPDADQAPAADASADARGGADATENATDGSAADGPLADGPGTDGAGADGANADGPGADGAGTDGARPDAAGADAAGADAASADGAGGDGAGAEAAAGDGSSPEGSVGAEAGCGPTNTVANCAACGNACDTTHSTGTSCNGVSCQYSGCASGWGDCVGAGGLDLDGCETRLDSLTNCTGCGLACDTTTSLAPACNGTTCTYGGCKPGYADCRTTAPDVDGCETQLGTTSNCAACGDACNAPNTTGAACGSNGCTYSGCAAGWSTCDTSRPSAACACNTPACCGSSCETTHDDGFGHHFYDCNPLDTYTSQEALNACGAYTGDASTCSGGWYCGVVAEPVICNSTTVAGCTVCWTYSGPNVGVVTPCTCTPGQSLGTWR